MAVVLTLISVIMGGTLAYVNQVTKPTIAKVQQQALEEGIKNVLGGSEVNVDSTVACTDTNGQPVQIYYTDKGMAVKATDPKGVGGKLTALVGLDYEGNILGYQILETSETPGLGAKAQTWFQAGAKGNIIGKAAGNLTVSKDGGEVDAITASTITSRAFLRIVNSAAATALGRPDAATGASPQHHN